MALKRGTSSANLVNTFDGQPMHEYAAKLPKIHKQSNDKAVQKAQDLEFRCLQRIVDQCIRATEYIVPLHSELLMIDPHAKAQTEDTWCANAKTIGGIPKQWKIGFILAEAARHKVTSLTAEYLKKVESDDSGNVSELFCALVQLPDTMTLPKGIDDGLIASRIFKERAAKMGGRLLFMQTKSAFATDGSIDFQKGGCFEMTWGDSGAATHVVHKPSSLKVGIPSHVNITKAYTLHSNNLDHKAYVQLKPNMYTLADLFAADAPFKLQMYNKGKKWKAFADIVSSVSTEHAEAEKAANAEVVVADVEVTADAAKKRSSANLETARVKLAANKAERERKKAMTFE